MKQKGLKKILATLFFFLSYLLLAQFEFVKQLEIDAPESPGNLLFPGGVGHSFDSRDFYSLAIDLIFIVSVAYGLVSVGFWIFERIKNPKKKISRQESGRHPDASA